MRSGSIAHCLFYPVVSRPWPVLSYIAILNSHLKSAVIALFEALSDQESDQERGASKQLAPLYRTRI